MKWIVTFVVLIVVGVLGVISLGISPAMIPYCMGHLSSCLRVGWLALEERPTGLEIFSFCQRLRSEEERNVMREAWRMASREASREESARGDLAGMVVGEIVKEC